MPCFDLVVQCSGSLPFEKQCFYQDVLFADPVNSRKLKFDQDRNFLGGPTLHVLHGDLNFGINFATVLAALSMLWTGADQHFLSSCSSGVPDWNGNGSF